MVEARFLTNKVGGYRPIKLEEARMTLVIKDSVGGSSVNSDLPLYKYRLLYKEIIRYVYIYMLIYARFLGQLHESI